MLLSSRLRTTGWSCIALRISRFLCNFFLFRCGSSVQNQPISSSHVSETRNWQVQPTAVCDEEDADVTPVGNPGYSSHVGWAGRGIQRSNTTEDTQNVAGES